MTIRLLICRATLTAFIGVVSVGCSSIPVSAESPSVATENEFNRTTNCVNGGLPMEIQFVLPNNPPKSLGSSFNIEEVDRIAGQVDSRIAELLEAAMLRAWELTIAEKKPWSKQFLSQLEIELAGEIMGRAPSMLQLEFCGDGDAVGSAALAAISGYFSRTLQLEDGRHPEWLEALGAPAADRGTSIMLMSVALRLAKIKFEPKDIAQSFAH
jgi:hypothetical protein